MATSNNSDVTLMATCSSLEMEELGGRKKTHLFLMHHRAKSKRLGARPSRPPFLVHAGGTRELRIAVAGVHKEAAAERETLAKLNSAAIDPRQRVGLLQGQHP